MDFRSELAKLALGVDGHSSSSGAFSPDSAPTCLQAVDAARINPQQDHNSDHHGLGIFSGNHSNRLDTQIGISGPDGQKFR